MDFKKSWLLSAEYVSALTHMFLYLQHTYEESILVET